MARATLEPLAAWDELAERLAAGLRVRTHAPGLEVQAIEPLEGGHAVAAVDGGAAVVLEGGGLAVGAVRAAGLAWRAHAPAIELAAPLEAGLLDEGLAARLQARLPGLAPADGHAGLLDRWRALREWERAVDLCARLGPGDVLLVDGSLAPREWPAPARRSLAERCAARGVLLAGVCKSTSAQVEGQPAALAAARAARGVPPPWFAPLPTAPGLPPAVMARFHSAGRVFRVEGPEGWDPGEVLARLAPWARDAGYPGYPYPLALAHNRCALDEALVEDLGLRLRAAALQRGASDLAWEEAFGDFHEVLDRGL